MLSKTSASILEILVAHRDDGATKMIEVVRGSFPDMTDFDIYGVILMLHKQGYIQALFADDKPQYITVSESAGAMLREERERDAEASRIGSIHIGNISGYANVGNQGGSKFHVDNRAYTVMCEIHGKLAELEETAKNSPEISKEDYATLIELIKELKKCIDENDKPKKGFFDRLTGLIQRNAWFTSHIARMAIDFFQKFVEQIGG